MVNVDHGDMTLSVNLAPVLPDNVRNFDGNKKSNIRVTLPTRVDNLVRDIAYRYRSPVSNTYAWVIQHGFLLKAIPLQEVGIDSAPTIGLLDMYPNTLSLANDHAAKFWLDQDVIDRVEGLTLRFRNRQNKYRWLITAGINIIESLAKQEGTTYFEIKQVSEYLKAAAS